MDQLITVCKKDYSLYKKLVIFSYVQLIVFGKSLVLKNEEYNSTIGDFEKESEFRGTFCEKVLKHFFLLY